MNFKWEINISDVIAVATFCVVIYRMHLSNIKILDEMKAKVDALWTHFVNGE